MDIELFEEADLNGTLDAETVRATETLLAESAARRSASQTATGAPVVVARSQTTLTSTAAIKSPPTKKRKTAAAKAAAAAAALAVTPPASGSTTTVATAPAVILPPVLKTFFATAGGYHKGDDAVLFRATYADASQLGAVLASLHGVLTDYELYFDSRTGLTVVGMNAVNTIYIEVSVPREAFAVFNLGDDDANGKPLPTTARFSLSAKQLFALRREFARDYTLTFCALLGTKIDAAEELYVQLHPSRAENARAPDGLYAVPQFEGEHEALREIEPASLYQFRVVVRMADFAAQIEKWSRYGDIAFRLSNRGLDVLGFDGDTKTSGQCCINYTDDTSKDRVLSAYKVFHGPSETDRCVITPEERAMMDALGASRVMLCHLDRLVRRTVTCAHMDCLLGDEAGGGRPTCRRDETTAARLAQIDNARFRSKFVKSALATLDHNSEYLELFFGRKRPPEDDEFWPMMMRARVLNEARDRVLISRVVYVCVCLNEK